MKVNFNFQTRSRIEISMISFLSGLSAGFTGMVSPSDKT